MCVCACVGVFVFVFALVLLIVLMQKKKNWIYALYISNVKYYTRPGFLMGWDYQWDKAELRCGDVHGGESLMVEAKPKLATVPAKCWDCSAFPSEFWHDWSTLENWIDQRAWPWIAMDRYGSLWAMDCLDVGTRAATEFPLRLREKSARPTRSKAGAPEEICHRLEPEGRCFRSMEGSSSNPAMLMKCRQLDMCCGKACAETCQWTDSNIYHRLPRCMSALDRHTKTISYYVNREKTRGPSEYH